MRVLIVDDEAKVCNLVCKLIDWEGLGLELAGIMHDGAEALAFIKEQQPDIVITDIRMPGCNGMDMISQIRQLNLNTHFIIISGYRQFEYATHAIRCGVEDYLLKPLKQKDIDKVLRKIVQENTEREANLAEKATLMESVGLERGRLRERFVNDLLDGLIKPEELLPESLALRYGFSMDGGSYLLVVVQNLSLRLPDEQTGRTLMNNKIKTIVESELLSAFSETVTTVQHNRIACAVRGSGELPGGLHKLLRRIGAGIQGLGDIFESLRFIVTASLPVERVQDLPQCVEQIRKTLAQRILLPLNATVQYAPAFEPAFAVGDLISFKTRNDLRLAISGLDEDQLVAVIRGVQAALTGEPRATGWDIQAAYFELIRLFLASTLDCGMKAPAGLEKEMEQRYEAANSVADLFNRLTERLVNAMMDWQVGKSAEESRPIRIARKFIHQHYAEPLTLQMLSDHVSLNATYFSSAFKRETGQTFLDYVTRVRVDAAKELLADTDMGISDIAERVGYQDIKYFYKRFRKFAGLGPKEYRKLYG